MLYFVYEGADKAKGLMRHYMKRLSPECRSGKHPIDSYPDSDP